MQLAPLIWRERSSDSRFVQSIWTSTTNQPTTRIVIADPCISITLVKDKGRKQVIITGPNTMPYKTQLTSGYTSLTIRLKSGVFLANLPIKKLTNKSCSILADAKSRFWFAGVQLQFPDFDTAESLVKQLYILGHLVSGLPGIDYSVTPEHSSSRTHSRQIQRATGLTPYRLFQLQRMHQALRMLKQGRPAAEVASELAFTDQSHFIRASKQFFGYTPRRLLDLPQIP